MEPKTKGKRIVSKGASVESMKRRRILIFSLLVAALLVSGCGLWVWQAKRQYALDRQLIDALMHNETKQALALVNAGADPNTHFDLPPTPSVKLLLTQLLYRTPQRVNDTTTAFMVACGTIWYPLHDVGISHLYVEENLPLLHAMLAHGANIHARTIDKRTALHSAVDMGQWHTAQWLLQCGADVNAQDNMGCTPLMTAAKRDASSLARLLILHGATPNAQDAEGDTALHYAIYSPFPEEVMPELLALGVDPDLKDKDGETPLQLAESKDRSDLVSLLCKGAK